MKLRDYQEAAINSFFNSNNNGILDMATGTGKTFTSLYAASEMFKSSDKQFLVIIVPFLHLIDQWVKDFALFGIDHYIKISGSKRVWMPKIEKAIWEYNRDYRNKIVVIGSYKSIMNVSFQKNIENVTKGTFLIADECHYIGSKEYRKNNFGHFESKLGLSATPRRWWDEEGTRAINRLFKKVVFTLSLDEAILNNSLTPYMYYPIIVDLSGEESQIYASMTKKITRLFSRKNRTQNEDDILKSLLIKRSKIIQNADMKQIQLLKILKEQKDKSHTLVYCGAGQVDEIVNLISSLGIKVHRFNSEIGTEKRKMILKLFDAGEIEVLVAIKCLDEGVDVPSTRTAYFLASTSNPREFIQRRGRILRKANGKNRAEIYDFIVLPGNTDKRDLSLQSFAEKELPRFAEFSQSALNEYEARKALIPYLESQNLNYLMDITPWEMYQQIRERGEL